MERKGRKLKTVKVNIKDKYFIVNKQYVGVHM